MIINFLAWKYYYIKLLSKNLEIYRFSKIVNFDTKLHSTFCKYFWDLHSSNNNFGKHRSS